MRTSRVFFAAAMVWISAVAGADAGDFNAGDAVEAHSYAWGGPTGWGKAHVVAVDDSGQHIGPYQVRFDASGAMQWVAAEDIRAAAPPAPPPAAPAGPNVAASEAPPPGGFAVGSRVEDRHAPSPLDRMVLLQRGVVLAADGNRYTVRYDGCADSVQRDVSQLRAASAASAGDPDVRFTLGAWRMFMPGAPNTVVRGDTVYRETGVGANAPPLQINVDGTYVWKKSFDAPPIRGRWTADAKVEFATMGTEVLAGVVIKDETGAPWKAYRYVPMGGRDGGGRIVVRRMCDAVELMGSR